MVHVQHAQYSRECDERETCDESYMYGGAKLPTIVLHSYFLFWHWPSYHCPDQPSLPTRGLAFRWNGSFHLGLLGPSCQIRSVSSQGSMPMEATWRGLGTWQSVGRRVRCQAAPSHQTCEERSHPGKGSSGPDTPADGMWIRDETPGQVLPGSLTHQTASKAKMVIFSH